VWQRLRPQTSTPVELAPVVESPIETKAKRMIADGEVTVQSVRAMSSHELEKLIRNLAFCRELELLPKPRPTRLGLAAT